MQAYVVDNAANGSMAGCDANRERFRIIAQLQLCYIIEQCIRVNEGTRTHCGFPCAAVCIK